MMMCSSSMFTWLAFLILFGVEKITICGLRKSVKLALGGGGFVLIWGLLRRSWPGTRPEAEVFFWGLLAVAGVLMLMAILSPKREEASFLVIAGALAATFLVLTAESILGIGVGLVLMTALSFLAFEGKPERFASPFLTAVLADALIILGVAGQATAANALGSGEAVSVGLVVLGVVLKEVIPSSVSQSLVKSFLREGGWPLVGLSVVLRGASALPSLALTVVACLGAILFPLKALTKTSVPLMLEAWARGAWAVVLLVLSLGAADKIQGLALALFLIQMGARLATSLLTQALSGETDSAAMGGLASKLPTVCALWGGVGAGGVLWALLGLAGPWAAPAIQAVFCGFVFLWSLAFAHLFERIFLGVCRADDRVMAYIKAPSREVFSLTAGVIGAAGVAAFREGLYATSPFQAFLALACLLGVFLRQDDWWERFPQRRGFLKHLFVGLSSLFERARGAGLRAWGHLRFETVLRPFFKRASQFFFDTLYPDKISGLVLAAFFLVVCVLYVMMLGTLLI